MRDFVFLYGKETFLKSHECRKRLKDKGKYLKSIQKQIVVEEVA